MRKRPGANVFFIFQVQILRQIGTLILLFFLLFVVKVPGSVGTGYHAVFTSDAAPEVLHHNAVLTFIGRLSWTDGNTGRVLAVHARHGNHFHILGRKLTVANGEDLMPVGI